MQDLGEICGKEERDDGAHGKYTHRDGELFARNVDVKCLGGDAEGVHIDDVGGDGPVDDQ